MNYQMCWWLIVILADSFNFTWNFTLAMVNFTACYISVFTWRLERVKACLMEIFCDDRCCFQDGVFPSSDEYLIHMMRLIFNSRTLLIPFALLLIVTSFQTNIWAVVVWLIILELPAIKKKDSTLLLWRTSSASASQWLLWPSKKRCCRLAFDAPHVSQSYSLFWTSHHNPHGH